MAFVVQALLDAAIAWLIPRKAAFALLVALVVVCGIAIGMSVMDIPASD